MSSHERMHSAEFQMDFTKASVYTSAVLEQMPRLLSLLDREPFSVTFGSFDREHWGWKFRDFPLPMAQSALYPLALLWRLPFPADPYHGNPEVLRWILAAIEHTCVRQHKNGAFDSVGPYTQDHGVTLAMVYYLTEARRLLKEYLPSTLDHTIGEVVARGCEFARRSREDYAFISNHQALFALAFQNAYELLDDERLARQADEIVDGIIAAQSDEGWYREYRGADPGYESLGIFYLATYWNRTGDMRLLRSLERSVRFFAYCVHPDGSIGGNYGSRYTSLYFPGGFELLAGEIPMAASVARFMRTRLEYGNVLTPVVADAENLPVLAYVYLNACQRTREPGPDQPALPLQAAEGICNFAKAGLVIAANQRYYAVLNTAKGGVCRVFDKQLHSLTYEDSGYILCAEGARFTSQATDVAGMHERHADQVVMTTCMAEVRQELPTPVKYVLLRLLNLTLFRHVGLGAWVRRKIIERLILSRRSGPATLTRRVTFDSDEIRFHDRVELTRRVSVERIELTRRFTPIHMGSAKYFHSSELQSTPLPLPGIMLADLKRDHHANCEFSLRFGAAGSAESLSDSVEGSLKP